METLSIGRLARAAEVNVETIRYYERRGLLPGPARARNGYRQYGEDDLWRLSFIRRAQGYGFTLREIAELLDVAECGPCDGVLRRALTRLQALDGEIERLRATRERLASLVSVCERGLEDECLALLADVRGGEDRG